MNASRAKIVSVSNEQFIKSQYDHRYNAVMQQIMQLYRMQNLAALVCQKVSVNSEIVIHCVSKKVPTLKLSVILSNLNRFSKCLHCWKAYEICYETHMTLRISP